MSTSVKSLDNSIDLHVLIAPSFLWRADLRCIFASVCLESISSGFVRVSPEVTLKELRGVCKQQLESDILPNKYHFLKNVGRHMALVSSLQEEFLKVSLFAPPFVAVSEIYIIDSVCIDKSSSNITVNPSTGNLGITNHRYSLSPLRPRQYLARSSHFPFPGHYDSHRHPMQQVSSSNTVDYQRRRRAATLDGSELMRHVTAALGNITEEPFPACRGNRAGIGNQQSDTACATIASTSQESSVIADCSDKKTSRLKEKRQAIEYVSDSVRDTLSSNLASSSEGTAELSNVTTTESRPTTSNVSSSPTSSWVDSDSGGTSLQSASWVDSVGSCQSLVPSSPSPSNLHVDLNLQGIEVAAATVALEQTLFGARPDGEGASICDDETDTWVGNDVVYQMCDKTGLKSVVTSSCIEVPGALLQERNVYQSSPGRHLPNTHIQNGHSILPATRSRLHHQTPNRGLSFHQTPDMILSPQQLTHRQPLPNVTADGHTTSHLTSDERTTPHLTSDEYTTLHLTSDEHTTPHLTSDEHTTPHLTSDEHTTPHLTSDKYTNLHLTFDERTTPHLKSDERTTPRHTADECTTPHHPADECTTPHHTVDGHTAPHCTADERTTPRHTADGHTTPHHPADECTTPHHTADGHITPHHPSEIWDPSKCMTDRKLKGSSNHYNSLQDSFPKSPPLPPITSSDSDIVLNATLADLRKYRTLRTKMLTKYRELCLKAKSLKDELKKKIEQDEQHWKTLVVKEKQLHTGLQDQHKTLVKECEKLSRRLEVSNSTPVKDQATSTHKLSHNNNMKALAVKLERENNNLQKRIRLTQEELRLEQESHREITEDYKKLKKTLTDKKIARKSVRS